VKPVHQTLFGSEGNCLITCFACILEVSLESTPTIYCDYKRWPESEHRLREWLGQYGLDYLMIDVCRSPGDITWPKGYHILGGPGPRGCGHAVVGFNGMMVHDPHPSGEGLLKIEDYTFIIAKMLGPTAPTESNELCEKQCHKCQRVSECHREAIKCFCGGILSKT